jgi:DnaJ-class molecular chaperone
VKNGHTEKLKGKGAYHLLTRHHLDVSIMIYWGFESHVKGVHESSGDVDIEVELSLQDVMCGFDKQIELSHLDEPARVTSLAYRDPSQPLSVPGLGVGGAVSSSSSGALNVHFRVVFPNEHSQEALRLAKMQNVLQRVFVGQSPFEKKPK